MPLPAVSLRIRLLVITALLFALLALLPRATHGQFGADFRLTGPPDVYSQTAYNNAWSVATDGLHRVHTIYHDGRNAGVNGDFAPFYREYIPGLGWQAEVRLPVADPVQCRYVSIATDCRNRVHVLFTHHTGDPMQPDQLFYKLRDTTGTWGPDVLLRQVPNPVPFQRLDGPSLAVDSYENVFVVWSEGEMNLDGDIRWNVAYRIYDAGAATWMPHSYFTAYVPFRPFMGLERWWPTVAVRNFHNGHTVAYAAWADYVQSQMAFRAVRYIPPPDPFMGFGLVGPANALLGGPLGVPTLAARCNDLHLAWSNDFDGVIHHRLGQIFFSDTTIFPAEAPSGLNGYSPNLAADGLGNAHLVSEGGGAVSATRWDKVTATWGVPGPVSDLGAMAGSPSVARDERGDLHVVWADYRSDPPGVGAYYDRGACLAVVPQEPGGPPAARRARLEPELVAAAAAATPATRLPVVIVHRERHDLAALRAQLATLPAAERGPSAARALADAARPRLASLLADLAARVPAGEAARVLPLPIAGAVAAEVTPALLAAIVARADVDYVLYDPPRPMIEEERGAVPGLGSGRPARALDPPVPAWSVSWIGAPAVWDLGYRGQCVLVGVIDTGVNYTHPDLANRVWANADEDPNNGLDDDGNGFVDDYRGYDFANADPDPIDDNGHGTHVSGTVAGDGTGGTATGVAPQASVMPVKVLAGNGFGTSAAIVAGINYALANGCQVMNLSLGAFCPTAALRDLYRLTADAVGAAGVTMCVAAGNDRCLERPPNVVGTPGDVPPPWLNPGQPVTGSTSGVTSVGATGYMNNVVAYFSSPGPVDWSQPPSFLDWWLCDPLAPGVGLIKPDVCAPGEGVNSTLALGGYSGDTWDGTSMATPHVAGLAALMLSKNNQMLSAQIHQILETTALDLGPAGKDNDYGAGRVSATAAIAATPPPPGQSVVLVSHAVTGGDGNGKLDAGETSNIVVTLLNDGPYLLGDVVGLLTDNSTSVTIPDDLSAYGDIPVNDLRNNSTNPYAVTVAPDAPDGQVVTFSVLVASYGACGAVTFADTLHNAPVDIRPGGEDLQTALALRAVAPNPARSGATFTLALRDPGWTRLTLHDVQGRLVRVLADGVLEPGVRRFPWDGREEGGARARPGVYFARAAVAGAEAERRFVVVGE